MLPLRKVSFVSPEPMSRLTRRDEDARIAFVISVSEPLKHPVYLLCFLWQRHFHQKFPQRHIDGIAEEHEPAHVATQNRR